MPLPKSTSTSLILTQPTHAEILSQRSKNSTEWKGALTTSAYFRREEQLLDQLLTRNGGLTPWALVVDEDDESGDQQRGQERTVLASCETIRKKALVCFEGEDGKVREVRCHGVASVFCPVEYRGRGYAGRMIEELGERLRGWQVNGGEGETEGGDVLFSVLWSDIGKKFYAKHLWHPFPSAHVSLPPAETAPAGDKLPQTRPLGTDDVTGLCEVDERLIRTHVARAAKRGKTAVAIVPDAETILWHLGREDFIANELYGKLPEVKGAIVGEKPGERAWVWWMRVWNNAKLEERKGNYLVVLRLVVEDETYDDLEAASEEGVLAAKKSRITAATAALLAAAQGEASRDMMEYVEIWNPTSATLAAARVLSPDAKVDHREEESICSLRWYGDGSDAEAAREVQWIGNEKYGWC